MNVCLRSIVAAALGALLCAAGDAPGGRAGIERLQALLAERRELEAGAAREERAWQAEKEALALLRAERKARVAELEQRSDALQARTDALAARVKAAQDEAAALARRADDARAWLKTALARLKAAVEQNPLLGDGAARADMARAAAAETPRAEAHAALWRAVMRSAARALEARVETEEIELGGAARAVVVVRLGGSAAFFVTPDRAECGYAEVRDGRIVWLPFSREYAAGLAGAARAIRGEAPAEALWVPLPRARIVREDGGR
jgi:hypothetical protein